MKNRDTRDTNESIHSNKEWAAFIDIIRNVSVEITQEIDNLLLKEGERILEVRLRAGQTCAYCTSEKTHRGKLVCDKELLNKCINQFVNYSYYAYEEELANGYITLKGGCRAGICGRAVVSGGKVILIREISSVNLRHAQEFIGISDGIIHKLFNDDGSFANTLIVSPPRCGKTTLIRDIARNLSERGYSVGICDERSEIAGMYGGYPSFYLGPNTDIMDCCPKAEGMLMLLRAMAPDIIVTDEIGKAADLDALDAALLAGTGIITTVHGSGFEELIKGRLACVIEKKVFKRIIFLSGIPKPGTVREIKRID